MTEKALMNGAAQVLGLPRDFNVSWAGPTPSWIDADLCFGSDEGSLLFTSADMREVGRIREVIADNEAVNGVAFLDNKQIAISGRNELAFLTSDSPPGGTSKHALIEVGAHDVIATRSRHFVAPLGVSGIMLLRPADDNLSLSANVLTCELAVNFYKGMSQWHDGNELLAFAARHGGVFATRLLSQSPLQNALEDFRWFRCDGLDIISICSLGSHSAAALDRKGTIVLFHDLLFSKGERPLTLSFPNIVGTAYTMLKVQDHIVVLTSRAVYILKDLALRFRRYLELGAIDSEPIFMPSFDMEVVDIHPYRSSKFLMVLPDAVTMVDLNSMLEERKTTEFTAQQTNGTWQYGCITTHSSLQPMGA